MDSPRVGKTAKETNKVLKIQKTSIQFDKSVTRKHMKSGLNKTMSPRKKEKNSDLPKLPKLNTSPKNSPSPKSKKSILKRANYSLEPTTDSSKPSDLKIEL